MDYTQRVALVTGASSGIGRQIALDFASRGATLLLAARRADRLEAVARECAERGGQARPLVGDLADPEFTVSLVDEALDLHGRLDIVVNNAGIPKHKHIYDVTPKDIDYTLNVNLVSAMHLSLAALGPMLRQGEGWIVNISSGAGRMPPPRETIYAASKYGLTGFTEGLWLDLAGSNVHPAVIHVGPIDTEIWDKAAKEGEVRFRGRKYPPSLVSDAVFSCIEKRRYEMTVPGSLRWVILFKTLMPGLFRWGAGRWDPVPEEVVAEARGDAGG